MQRTRGRPDLNRHRHRNRRQDPSSHRDADEQRLLWLSSTRRDTCKPVIDEITASGGEAHALTSTFSLTFVVDQCRVPIAERQRQRATYVRRPPDVVRKGVSRFPCCADIGITRFLLSGWLCR